MVGTILGAIALGLLSNVLNLLQIPSFYQTPVKGILVVGAVLIPALAAQVLSRRQARVALQRPPMRAGARQVIGNEGA